jgi:hypothetical protein
MIAAAEVVIVVVVVFAGGDDGSVSYPITGWEKPLGSQELRLPEFLRNRNKKVVRLSALGTGRFYLQDIPLTLIPVKRIGRPQGQITV